MSNRFEEIYESLDAKLLAGAEKAVQAWNWTTGRTRTDLANALLRIAPICEIGGLVFSTNKNLNFYESVYLVAGGLMMGAVSFAKIDHNRGLEKREEDALRQGCLDPLAEECRESGKSESATYGILGTMVCTATLVPQASTATNLVGAGFFMRAASAYIMRVSNLPPRKDCLSRGIDHLKQGLESLAEEQPQPAYVLTYIPGFFK